MRTFIFYTDVNKQEYPNAITEIPFDCEDVPYNGRFLYASNDNLLCREGEICREIHNSTLIYKYAYFVIDAI